MSDALSAAVSIGFHGLAFAMVLYLISVGLSVTMGAAWAAENNPKSDGAPEMIIAARRKLIRQLRLGSGTSLGLCRLLYRRMVAVCAHRPRLLRRASSAVPARNFIERAVGPIDRVDPSPLLGVLSASGSFHNSQRVGDLAAFDLVRAHFQILNDIKLGRASARLSVSAPT